MLQRSHMERRSFLHGISSILPIAALQEMLARHVEARNAPNQAPALHIVGAGQDRFDHPHTTGFSTGMLFKVSATDTNGALFVMEHTHLTPGGPPLHLHLQQEEWFYVMAGDVAFQVGDRRINLKAGESLLGPRQIPHTFSSVGPGPARMLIAFCPAGKMEQYFHEVEANPRRNADPEFWKSCEMELLGPSPFWKT
jgi:mannose-6-phosphate isomerase-like protein (cupin superfamily)